MVAHGKVHSDSDVMVKGFSDESAACGSAVSSKNIDTNHAT